MRKRVLTGFSQNYGKVASKLSVNGLRYDNKVTSTNKSMNLFYQFYVCFIKYMFFNRKPLHGGLLDLITSNIHNQNLA